MAAVNYGQEIERKKCMKLSVIKFTAKFEENEENNETLLSENENDLKSCGMNFI